MSVTSKYKDSKIKKRGRKVETKSDHPAMLNNFQDGDYRIIPLDYVDPDPNQPRKNFDEESLQELANSIKRQGVLQPVLIRIGEGGRFILISGERRYRASQIAGLNEIPAIIKNNADPDEVSLIENIQREDLKPIEEAEGYARLMKKHDYTHKQLVEVVGKSRTTITQTLSLNNLPDEIKSQCPRVDIPKRVLIELARKKSETEMIDLFNQLKSNVLPNVRSKKASKQPKQRIIRSKSVIALDRADSLSNFLLKVNFESEPEDERMELMTKLHQLKNQIEELLK